MNKIIDPPLCRYLHRGFCIIRLKEKGGDDMTRVFFDMDGVLARYRQVPYEEMLKEGFFAELDPQEEALEALKSLARDPGLEVCVLSAVIGENPYALGEKKRWLAAQLGEDLLNVKSFFPLCGTSKRDAVPGGVRPTDILIDDYNMNLNDWGRQAVPIKYLNGINDRHGSWKGLRASGSAESIVRTVYEAIDPKRTACRMPRPEAAG